MAATDHRVKIREDRAERFDSGDASGLLLNKGGMKKTKTYDATVEIGLPVKLVGAVNEHADGSVEIPNLDMLLATVAVARVLAPVQMVGRELRFVRHVLDLTGTEFAHAIDLSDKTVVSRWENDRARPGGYTEKVIRQLVLNLLGRRAPGIDIGDNAIPGMKVRPRDPSEGSLPMAFKFGKRAGKKGQPLDCYAERRRRAYASAGSRTILPMTLRPMISPNASTKPVSG